MAVEASHLGDEHGQHLDQDVLAGEHQCVVIRPRVVAQLIEELLKGAIANHIVVGRVVQIHIAADVSGNDTVKSRRVMSPGQHLLGHLCQVDVVLCKANYDALVLEIFLEPQESWGVSQSRPKSTGSYSLTAVHLGILESGCTVHQSPLQHEGVDGWTVDGHRAIRVRLQQPPDGMCRR